MSSLRIARLNDYGFKLNVSVVDSAGAIRDISAATTKEYKIEKPDGTVSSVNADFDSDGTDGLLTWTSTTGFFDTAGTYKIEANISGTGFQYRTTRGELQIQKVLS